MWKTCTSAKTRVEDENKDGKGEEKEESGAHNGGKKIDCRGT